MKKKMVLIIGIIALFLGMSTMPVNTAIKMQPVVESQNDDIKYEFSGTVIMTYHCSYGVEGILEQRLICFGIVNGTVSDVNHINFFQYSLTLHEGDSITVQPVLGRPRTYDSQTFSVDGYSFSGFFIPGTVEY